MNSYTFMNSQDKADYKAYLKSLIKPIREEGESLDRRTFVTLVNNKNIEKELATLK